MKAEAQRIAIAEAVGDFEDLKAGKSFLRSRDYLNDLNAIHEAEKTLKGRKVFWFYNINLPSATKADRKEMLDVRKVAGATAAQRSEAFLKTIGKWIDNET